MKNLVILAFALIVSGSAFAAENLTSAQMDTISAGARNVIIHAHNNQLISVKDNAVLHNNHFISVKGNKGGNAVLHNNHFISVKGNKGGNVALHNNQFISVKDSNGVQVVAPNTQVVTVSNSGDVTSVQQTWVIQNN